MDNNQQPLARRQFLAQTAYGTAAAAMMPGLLASSRAHGGEERKPWKMRLSGSSICFSKLPIEKALARLADLGYEAVDVWSGHAGCPHLDDVLNRLGPNGLQEELEKNNLKLYTFSVYSGGYRKYAELLGKAGGGVAVQGSAGPVDPKELTTRMKAYIEGLKPLLELAEKYDSYLAIENHGHALLDSLDSFKAFVDINRHPRLGIAMAPYHLQALNVSTEEAIRVVGKQLFFFYAWQKSPGTAQLPGIGPVDCTPWIKALAEVDYKWYVNPFLHGEPEPDETSAVLAKSNAYLKKCYAKAVRG